MLATGWPRRDTALLQLACLAACLNHVHSGIQNPCPMLQNACAGAREGQLGVKGLNVVLLKRRCGMSVRRRTQAMQQVQEEEVLYELQMSTGLRLNWAAMRGGQY